jgi:hypothetical protein
MSGRIASGEPGLDAVVSGGPPGARYLCAHGPPRTGKTILAQQYIFGNANGAVPARGTRGPRSQVSESLARVQRVRAVSDVTLRGPVCGRWPRRGGRSWGARARRRRDRTAARSVRRELEHALGLPAEVVRGSGQFGMIRRPAMLHVKARLRR